MVTKASSSPVPHEGTVEKVAQIISSVANEAVKLRPIAPSDSLTDAGVSSLDMVNVMLALEAAFDVFIPADLIKPSSFRSINSIAAMLESLQPHQFAVA